jgi:hypothetical protein
VLNELLYVLGVYVLCRDSSSLGSADAQIRGVNLVGTRLSPSQHPTQVVVPRRSVETPHTTPFPITPNLVIPIYGAQTRGQEIGRSRDRTFSLISRTLHGENCLSQYLSSRMSVLQIAANRRHMIEILHLSPSRNKKEWMLFVLWLLSVMEKWHMWQVCSRGLSSSSVLTLIYQKESNPGSATEESFKSRILCLVCLSYFNLPYIKNNIFRMSFIVLICTWCYKPKGRGFHSRCYWIFNWPDRSTALWPWSRLSL